MRHSVEKGKRLDIAIVLDADVPPASKSPDPAKCVGAPVGTAPGGTASAAGTVTGGATAGATVSPPGVEVDGLRGGRLFAVAGSVVVATGLGLGLIAGGIDRGTTALQTAEAIQRGGGSCVPGSANLDARCAGLRGEGDAADVMLGVGAGFVAAGGAVAAVIAIRALLISQGPTRQSTLVAPVVSAAGGGALLQGSF